MIILMLCSNNRHSNQSNEIKHCEYPLKHIKGEGKNISAYKINLDYEKSKDNNFKDNIPAGTG